MKVFFIVMLQALVDSQNLLICELCSQKFANSVVFGLGYFA